MSAMDLDSSSSQPNGSSDSSNDTFQAKSTSFMTWLCSLPGATISDKIDLADLRHRGAGRGVVAKQDVHMDEELFAIPRHNILSVDNSDLLHKLPSILSDHDPWAALTLVLIYEYLKGTSSIWKFYFDILPSTFDTLMFWSPVELAELQGSAVLGKVGKESADATFKQSIIPTICENPQIFYPSGTAPLRDDQLMVLAHRMGSTIMAYAFDLERDASQLTPDEEGYATEDEDEALSKGMVPLADMLNSDAHFNARLYHGTSTLTMRALENISKGDEILNDYGHLPRSDLLRRYGYTTSKYAPFDVAEVSRELIVDKIMKYRCLSNEDLQNRMEYLEDHDIIEDGYDISRPTNPESDITPLLSPSLLALTKILLATPTTYKTLKRLTSPQSRALDAEVGTVLAEVFSARLREYATSIAEDEMLLGKEGVEGRRRMAVEVRLAEKQILVAAREAAEMLGKEGKDTGNDDRGEGGGKRRKVW